MDSDFWTSRLAAAKRHLAASQHHHHHGAQLDRLNIDDFEVEEEIRPDFPCPFCYEDFDIGSLCSHLEDQHSFESKVTVCPICSVKVARDMLSHITLQHGHLLKRRRRLRRVAIPNSQTLSVLGRDLREAHLQLLLGGGGGGGGGGYRSNNAVSSSTPPLSDPFLSSLFLNFPTNSHNEDASDSSNSYENSTTNVVGSQPMWKQSFDPSLSHEEREKRTRQVTERAIFVQDLMISTLLFN